VSSVVPAGTLHGPVQPEPPDRFDDPGRVAEAPADEAAAPRTDWLGRVPALSVTYLSKFSVPPFGAMGLTLAIPLIFLASIGGLLTGRLHVAVRRFLFFVATMAVLWGIQLLRGEPFSVSSLLLLTVLHLPYVLFIPQGGESKGPQYDQALRQFQNIAVVIAGLGVVQYVTQFFLGPALAFPIENFVPTQFLVSRFNMQGYLEYGSEIYRTNGVFMLEPSFFSQLVALGIVVELIKFNRPLHLLVLAVSLVLSYSGTGLMVLALCLPFVLIKSGRWSLILGASLLAAAGLALVSLAGDVPVLDIFLKRSGEFTSKGSSGFARYVGGFYLFEQFLWPDPLRALFGFGAGSFQAFAMKATYAAAGTTLFKIVFEFGIVGAAAYFGFLFYCVKNSTAPGIVRLAVGFIYMLSGIHIPFAHGLALTLLVWNSPDASNTGLAREGRFR
jgi:hypothetical protein